MTREMARGVRMKTNSSKSRSAATISRNSKNSPYATRPVATSPSPITNSHAAPFSKVINIPVEFTTGGYHSDREEIPKQILARKHESSYTVVSRFTRRSRALEDTRGKLNGGRSSVVTQIQALPPRNLVRRSADAIKQQEGVTHAPLVFPMSRQPRISGPCDSIGHSCGQYPSGSTPAGAPGLDRSNAGKGAAVSGRIGVSGATRRDSSRRHDAGHVVGSEPLTLARLRHYLGASSGGSSGVVSRTCQYQYQPPIKSPTQKVTEKIIRIQGVNATPTQRKKKNPAVKASFLGESMYTVIGLQGGRVA